MFISCSVGKASINSLSLPDSLLRKLGRLLDWDSPGLLHPSERICAGVWQSSVIWSPSVVGVCVCVFSVCMYIFFSIVCVCVRGSLCVFSVCIQCSIVSGGGGGDGGFSSSVDYLITTLARRCHKTTRCNCNSCAVPLMFSNGASLKQHSPVDHS